MRRSSLLCCVTVLALACTSCICTANDENPKAEAAFLDEVAEDRGGLQSLLNWAIGAQLLPGRCTFSFMLTHTAPRRHRRVSACSRRARPLIFIVSVSKYRRACAPHVPVHKATCLITSEAMLYL